MLPLRFLGNFWENLEMLLINSEIDLILTWPENCVVSNAAENQNTTISITNTKLYVPGVTLVSEDNAKLLQQLKSGFKRKINWNKDHPKLKPVNAENPYLDYLIESSFQGVNRPFVLPLNALDDRTEH